MHSAEMQGCSVYSVGCRVLWEWGAACIVQGCRKHSVRCRVQRLIADSPIFFLPSTPILFPSDSAWQPPFPPTLPELVAMHLGE